MQIRHRGVSKNQNISEKKTRYNEMIRIPRIFLIDENGQSQGSVETSLALARAKELELDLVEVNPVVNPPVCKIMDFGKFKYEQDKLAHKQRIASKKVEIKGIRLSFKIKGGDLENRQHQAEKFLTDGNQVRIELILKGREKAHAENARQIINNFIDNFGTQIKIVQPVQKQGGKFSALIAPN